MEGLAERMQRCQRLKVRQPIEHPPRVQLQLKMVLHRAEAEFLPPDRGRQRERRIAKSTERRPTPPAEGVAESARSFFRVKDDHSACVRNLRLNRQCVDLDWINSEYVARSGRLDRLTPDCRTELGNPHLQRVQRVGRSCGAPHVVDESVDRDHGTCVNGKARQNSSGAHARHLNWAAVYKHFKRAEQPNRDHTVNDLIVSGYRQPKANRYRHKGPT